jgi:fumarate hydratase class II
MFERFTDRARRVMALANQEAQRFNHEYIGTEHILLGLVKEGSGVGANVLKNLDVDLRKVRLEVEKLPTSPPDMVTTGKLPQTPGAKKVIKYAIEEARRLNHHYIGTEHLLLGLFREQDGVACQVLTNIGVQLEPAREEVLSLLGEPYAMSTESVDDERPDGTRTEADSMGEMRVPAWAYWGAQTQRAVENFPISGYRLGRRFIRAMGLIKRAAAEVNHDLGKLSPKLTVWVAQAAQEVADGRHDRHFVVDVFQTGSGTSTNMNANEVISNRAIEIAGGTIGSRDPVHPNDHVNMGQSSNDVVPTAIHVSAAEAIRADLVPALKRLADALEAKAKAFDGIIKIGRTHLQDATPIRLGQEFSGYAAQARNAAARATKAVAALRELPIGGTAVGTGINTHPEFGRRVAAKLSEWTGIEFAEAANHFEAQASKDAVCEASGQLKAIAAGLTKIANDIRWLGSGPRCGIGELQIPATQPGSSIMPGKVNPVMSEMLVQVCTQVLAGDVAVTLGARDGNFELNVMMPIIAHNLLESIRLLSTAARVFADRCVAGIDVNVDRCNELIEQSLAMCTSLAPKIGYDRAAAIAKEAYATGQTVRQVAEAKGVLSKAEIDAVLDPRAMTEPEST